MGLGTMERRKAKASGPYLAGKIPIIVTSVRQENLCKRTKNRRAIGGAANSMDEVIYLAIFRKH
jgi:hypothetical protein